MQWRSVSIIALPFLITCVYVFLHSMSGDNHSLVFDPLYISPANDSSMSGIGQPLALHPLYTSTANGTSNGLKVIYGATELWQEQQWEELLDLTNCEYTNCISRHSDTSVGIESADVLLFAVRLLKKLPKVKPTIRQHQYWVIMSYESSAYPFNRFLPIYNNQFNATMMYRRDATFYYPWGKTIHTNTSLLSVNFAANKTRGTFAYLSNCHSQNFDRKALMLVLRNYNDVDIFSSSKNCPGMKKPPCPRLPKGSNPDCELKAHQSYRFFLAFENSLCKDYITEKFWDRLQSSSYFVPIAMGGLSLEEYTSVAPPDSFLHVYNFTSVHKLGEYLQYLMNNDEAYNRYHQWRYNYSISTSRGMSGCELCKLANEKPPMPAQKNIDTWFNDPKRCKSYTIKRST